MCLSGGCAYSRKLIGKGWPIQETRPPAVSNNLIGRSFPSVASGKEPSLKLLEDSSSILSLHVTSNCKKQQKDLQGHGMDLGFSITTNTETSPLLARNETNKNQ